MPTYAARTYVQPGLRNAQTYKREMPITPSKRQDEEPEPGSESDPGEPPEAADVAFVRDFIGKDSRARQATKEGKLAARKVVNDRYQEILDWQSEPGEAEGGERRMLRMLKITVIDVQRLKEALDSDEPGAQADLDKARESWKGRELTSMRKCFTQVLSMVDSNGGMPFLRQGYYQRTGRQGSPRGRAKAETIDDCCEPVQDWAGAMRALALGANYGDAKLDHGGGG
jgi:hypothetical protein